MFPLFITVRQILTDPSQILPPAMVQEPQCSRQQDSAVPPWLNSLGLDLSKGKIIRAAKMQGGTRNLEVTLAGVIRHRESRAAAQHMHMDKKAQSHPMPTRLSPHHQLLRGTQRWAHRCMPASPDLRAALPRHPGMDEQPCSPSHSTHAQLDPVSQDLLPGK